MAECYHALQYEELIRHEMDFIFTKKLTVFIKH
jgi:hypothetical protein